MAWWTAAYGAASRHSLDALLIQEWDDLFAGSRSTARFVGVAEDAQPVGVVYASLRKDRYLSISVGVLSWLYVAEEARGKGVSSRLMEAAECWMIAQGAEGREVFVTLENTPALKLYERFGYRVVDARMLVPAPH